MSQKNGDILILRRVRADYRYTSSWLPISSRTISFLVTRSVKVMR